jgi:hypothetical protein
MKTSQLNKLPHGTRVVWNGLDHGYVVNLTKSKPKAEPPLVYIQWDDGQRTDGRDNSALVHVLCYGVWD